MPAIMNDSSEGTPRLPFPPVTKSHIMHCSYHYWHPKYRAITPKTRLVPLSKPFVDYLRADGIILPDDDEPSADGTDTQSNVDEEVEDEEDEDEDEDIALGWRDVHQSIKETIAELGGKVMPKLNWSAPKDATWMNANTMECQQPSDVYLLLKSSDFVTHDLEHAFDDCADSPNSNLTIEDIPYHLVLRKSVPKFNPSVEFRCFVRERKLLCMCQRDLNHFDFLFGMQEKLSSLINQFFNIRLRDSFPDESFVFDVYVPAPYDRVWLIDINPWAPRTDPILFSWMELLRMADPPDQIGDDIDFVRLSIKGSSQQSTPSTTHEAHTINPSQIKEILEDDGLEDDGLKDDGLEDDDEDDDGGYWLPELRLIRKTDPEAYSFNTPQYSAHKLPKDVVEASQNGSGLLEFARDWQNILSKRQAEDRLDDSGDEA